MTMTLTEFLEARIAEDEADAREASGERLWRWSQHNNMIIADSGHMQRFTPARMLAECEAKRRIVDECRQCDQDNFTPRTETWGYREALRGSVQVLASVYADHGDYLPEWRP